MLKSTLLATREKPGEISLPRMVTQHTVAGHNAPRFGNNLDQFVRDQNREQPEASQRLKEQTPHIQKFLANPAPILTIERSGKRYNITYQDLADTLKKQIDQTYSVPLNDYPNTFSPLVKDLLANEEVTLFNKMTDLIDIGLFKATAVVPTRQGAENYNEYPCESLREFTKILYQDCLDKAVGFKLELTPAGEQIYQHQPTLISKLSQWFSGK